MRFEQGLVRCGVALVLCCGHSVFAAAPAQGAPQTIEIHSKKFAYTPAEITLHKGETYRLHLTSDDVTHSFRIKELGVSGTMKPNVFTDVLFTPTETGDFHADCGVYCGAGHKTMGMTVHVVDK